MFNALILHAKRFTKESPLILPILAFLVGGLVALPLATNAAPTAKTDIKFVSYNILVREYGDRTFPSNTWAKRKTIISSHIKSTGAPVVGLQESRYKDQRFAIRDLLGSNWKMTNYTSDPINMRDENAILWNSTKMTLLGNGSEAISSGYWINWVRLQDRSSGIKYYVFNTHYDHVESHTLRIAQANKTVEIVSRVTKPNSKDPIILMGDFNADNGTPPMKIIADAGYTNTRNAAPIYDGTKTWSGFQKVGNGYKRDHILFKNSPLVKTLSYKTDVSAYLGSDHLPINATLSLETETQAPAAPVKPDPPKPETPKPVDPKPENPKPILPKPETPKPTVPKPTEPKPINPTPIKPVEPSKTETPVQPEATPAETLSPVNPADNIGKTTQSEVTELPKTGAGVETLITIFLLGSTAAGITSLLQMRRTPLQ